MVVIHQSFRNGAIPNATVEDVGDRSRPEYLGALVLFSFLLLCRTQIVVKIPGNPHLFRAHSHGVPRTKGLSDPLWRGGSGATALCGKGIRMGIASVMGIYF